MGTAPTHGQPTVEIVAGDLQQRGLLAKPGGDAAAHLQAYFVVDRVFHGRETSRQAGAKEAGRSMNWSTLKKPPGEGIASEVGSCRGNEADFKANSVFFSASSRQRLLL